MAAQTVILNHDRLTKNYSLYRDRRGDREWSRFPWDFDQSFKKHREKRYRHVLYGDTEHPQSDRAEHSNALLDAILDTPRTRAMYLRRLQTLRDDYLSSGYFEERIAFHQARIAAEAKRDHARWGAGDIEEGVRALLANIAARRAELERDPLIPLALPSDYAADITFERIDDAQAMLNPKKRYLTLRNQGDYAIDLSGWRLTGDVSYTFQAGVVVPSQSVLFVSPNVSEFRNRKLSPKAGEECFVQGDYTGIFVVGNPSIQLIDGMGAVRAAYESQHIGLHSTPDPAPARP